MFPKPLALIFDMDGVLVDSEPLWRKAMIKGFAEIGILLSEEDCLKTQGTRFTEVVLYWLKEKQNKSSAKQVEAQILARLIETIHNEASRMPRTREILVFCRNNGIRTGLATSSAHALMEAVLDKLQLGPFFDITVSAERMPYGKPHPQVFLECAAHLGVQPNECLVLEDSVNGVIAAKAAQMQVIAIPDPAHRTQRQFALADHFCADFLALEQKVKALIG